MDCFGMLTTNRVSVSKYIERFKKNKQGDESLISPRPMPGSFQQRYFILLRFSGDTKNRAYFTAQKAFKPLSADEYDNERVSIEHYWEA